jgi:hypothetical protein
LGARRLKEQNASLPATVDCGLPTTVDGLRRFQCLRGNVP